MKGGAAVTKTIQAIYKDGVLKPLEPLEGIEENGRVTLTVHQPLPKSHPLADCFGILPDEDANEMREAIEREFERIDPDKWK